MRSSLKQYQNSNMAHLEHADPHTLISLVLQHILGNLAGAKGAIDRKEIETKNNMLSKVIGLIGELQMSLDMKDGGEISQNLYDLYGYMVSQVNKANLKNDNSLLDEVATLIIEIKSGWDAIPHDVRKQYS
jgi:flagellar protein FliS